jgi:MYXO-CTERM domain-containing protein
MSSLLLAMALSGNVVESHSFWTSDGSRIVTEATVDTPDGPVTVSQLGGTVDGLTMRTFPGPEILQPGMMVALDAHEDTDLRKRAHVVVDGVKVLAYPEGFVRTGPTKAGHYLYWESGCVFVTMDADGTKEIPGDGEFDVIQKSIDTWNDDTASCSYLTVMNQGKKAMEVGKDRVNLIKFRDQSWCRPAVDDDPARCYDPAAAGLTTATYVDDKSSDRDGAIVDADVEINGVDFSISVDGTTLGTQPCKSELQNTLTHELGHLHGLEHTCWLGGVDPHWVDDQGNPVPSCFPGPTDPPIPAKILDATMYPQQDCGETKKATLSDDDINAICTIYPTAKDPGTCAPVASTGGGCCSASRGADRPAGALLLAGVVAFWMRRRRKSPAA